MSKPFSILLAFIAVIFFVGSLSACSLSFIPKEADPSSNAVTLPSNISEPKLVIVQFIAHPVQSFSVEDELSLDIIDLVSGLNYQRERYFLQDLEDGRYAITVMLPEGATISYRYSLVKPIEVVELLPDGRQLPFRQLLVRENLVVNDIVSGWPEVLYNGTLASLNGVIADSETEAPLPDVLVNVAGKTALTDMNGRFFIRDLPVGQHNLVATKIDGSHRTFQQEVNLVDSLSTLAIIRMSPLPEVTLTFVMTPPNEAVGAPVRMAGNLSQLGQTIFDQASGTGALAGNMPLMSRNPDGKYVSQIKVHAGNFLSYRYTLGDAVVNAERNSEGARSIRQFIVPDRDTVIDDQVATWRLPNTSTLSFFTQSPVGTPEGDQLFMQFNQGSWSNSIPMWPMENGQWMLLYNPLNITGESIEYRYCRSTDCQIGLEDYQSNLVRSVMLGTTSEVRDEINGWRMLDSSSQVDPNYGEVEFNQETLRGVEIDHNYASAYMSSYYGMASHLKQQGFNWIILRPVWKVDVSGDLPYIDPDPKLTIPSGILQKIASVAKQEGFKLAIYPKLQFPASRDFWWNDTLKSSLWWQQWYADYEKLVTHTLKLASGIAADQIILGGPDASYTYPGAIKTVGENYGTPKTSEEIWNELLEKANQYYEGELLLAQNISASELSSHSFYEKTDGFYLEVDSELMPAGTYSIYSVGTYLDSAVYNFYINQNKALYFALNGPSFTTRSESTSPSYEIISPTNNAFNPSNVDLAGQTSFYSAYLENIAVRDWIKGVASQGFFPALELTDFSSSIFGKPAFFLFHNQ